MANASNFALSIRAALNRKGLADARHRAALTRQLAFTASEVLAIQHLARAGELTTASAARSCSSRRAAPRPSLIASASGTHHPLRASARQTHDRRSLTQAVQKSATEAWAPLVSELDGLALELSETERAAVARFLERAADAAQRHADRLARDADTKAFDTLAVPLPTLWA
jgi:hypothetical protein